MTDEPPTDLTALMSLDPLDLTKQDLDKIIAYQRKQRLAREGGAKTKRATSDAPAVDIKALLGRVGKTHISKEALQIGRAINDAADAEAKRSTPPKAPPKGFIRRL